MKLMNFDDSPSPRIDEVSQILLDMLILTKHLPIISQSLRVKQKGGSNRNMNFLLAKSFANTINIEDFDPIFRKKDF